MIQLLKIIIVTIKINDNYINIIRIIDHNKNITKIIINHINMILITNTREYPDILLMIIMHHNFFSQRYTNIAHIYCSANEN